MIGLYIIITVNIISLIMVINIIVYIKILCRVLATIYIIFTLCSRIIT